MNFAITLTLLQTATSRLLPKL